MPTIGPVCAQCCHFSFQLPYLDRQLCGQYLVRMPDIDRCELLSRTRQKFTEHPLLRWRKRNDVIIADLDLRPATGDLRNGDRPGRIELRCRYEHSALDAQHQQVVHQDG
ncbi:hypothetical protein PACF725_3405 [Pseudomonas aeruginosa]|nr:hypothetical protein PACF725_3405 [Pseudomonas aeruginosa]